MPPAGGHGSPPSWTRSNPPRPCASPWKGEALGHRGLHLERLAALGVDEAALASLPEEFRQGMVARAEMLGDTGANDPSHWVDKTASPDLHAIAILFARDAAERGRCATEHGKLIAECQGVEVLSTLDLEATPPFDYAHDHFGYRDRLSQPVIEGRGRNRRPARSAAQGRRVHPWLPG